MRFYHNGYLRQFFDKIVFEVICKRTLNQLWQVLDVNSTNSIGAHTKAIWNFANKLYFQLVYCS